MSEYILPCRREQGLSLGEAPKPSLSHFDSVSMSLCLSPSDSVSMSLCLSRSLSLILPLSFPLPLYLSVSLYVFLSLSVSLSVSMSLSLSLIRSLCQSMGPILHPALLTFYTVSLLVCTRSIADFPLQHRQRQQAPVPLRLKRRVG